MNCSIEIIFDLNFDTNFLSKVDISLKSKNLFSFSLKKYRLKFLSSGLLYRYASYLILKEKPKNKATYLKKKLQLLLLTQ